MPDLVARGAAVAAGLVADRLVREPPSSWHPVGWFGQVMTAVEGRLWRDHRRAGVAYTGLGVGLGLVAGRTVGFVAPAVTVVVAGSELRRIGRAIGEYAAAGDLAAARDALPSLVGRDPSTLDASGISAAVIESLAENEVDAVVAPVFWALVGGAPGAWAYRAINTMDAMVGHRSTRYERFGWASARLDDIANWIPARLFAGLVGVADRRNAARIARVVRRDAGAHPSPNAGVAETAVAGSLGVELGGTLRYGERVEHRPTLGDGTRPLPLDIERTAKLTSRIEWLLTATLAVPWIARVVWRTARPG